MHQRTLSLSLVLVAALAAASVDPVKIQWKPKSGSIAKYKLLAKAAMDGPQGAAEVVFGATVTSKVTDIKADGNIVVEETQSEISIKFGDQDFSSQAPQTITSKSTMTPSGEVKARETTDETANARMENSLEFIYPDDAMDVGKSWTIKRPADSGKGLYARETTFTYDGVEKIGQWDCYRIKTSFKETDAPTNMSYEGVTWVAIEDGTMIKATYKMKNVEFGPGLPPSDATAEISRFE